MSVTLFPQESSALNDQITSIEGGNNDLHGEWLLVTRKKRISSNPTSNSFKTVNRKANTFNALNSLTKNNQPSSCNQNSQSRPITIPQPRATQTPKETKRCRHDDVFLNAPILEYSPSAIATMSSVPKNKTPMKTTHIEKTNPNILNQKDTSHDPHKHASQDSIFTTHEKNYKHELPQPNRPGNQQHKHNLKL